MIRDCSPIREAESLQRVPISKGIVPFDHDAIPLAFKGEKDLFLIYEFICERSRVSLEEIHGNFPCLTKKYVKCHPTTLTTTWSSSMSSAGILYPAIQKPNIKSNSLLNLSRSNSLSLFITSNIRLWNSSFIASDCSSWYIKGKYLLFTVMYILLKSFSACALEMFLSNCVTRVQEAPGTSWQGIHPLMDKKIRCCLSCQFWWQG